MDDFSLVQFLQLLALDEFLLLGEALNLRLLVFGGFDPVLSMLDLDFLLVLALEHGGVLDELPVLFCLLEFLGLNPLLLAGGDLLVLSSEGGILGDDHVALEL